MQGWVRVEGGVEQTIQRLLGALLAQGVVHGLLVPLRTPDGRNAVPTLVRDPALLERAAPLAPVLPVNGGTVLGQVTATGAPGRVGAVLRNCELRAAVELSKVRQVVLDDVILIGIDCLGTYPVQDYARLVEQGLDPVAPLLAAASSPSPLLHLSPSLRPACTMCERPIPGAGESYPPHVTIGLLGVPNAERLWVTVRDESLGEGIAGVLGLEPAPVIPSAAQPVIPSAARNLTEPAPVIPSAAQPVIPSAARNLTEPAPVIPSAAQPVIPSAARNLAEPATRVEAIRALIAVRAAERDRRFATLRERLHEPQALLAQFATCIHCQNCMRACPICYCKECVFRTDVFDHPSARYWDWAERKGGVRLPSDTLLFHVTRLLHMVHACVGCGMCSDACPVGIPVADVFRAVGQAVQARFGYVPGRDPAEEMIVSTFREDELRELGEPEKPG